MNTRMVWWGLLGLTLAGVSVSYLHQAAHSPNPLAELPVLGEVPDFMLQNQSRQAVGRRTLKGKTWVADFIYTHCPDQCPMMTQKMAAVQAMIPREAPVELVSISVDPKRDDPAALSRYAERHHADSARWHFLTGTPDQIKALAGGFKLGAPQPAAKKGVIDHSSRLVLVDGEARIRGYYDGTDPAELQRLIRDVSAVSGADRPR